MKEKVFFIIIDTLLLVGVTYAQRYDTSFYYLPHNILNFANYLHNQGEYLSAAAEYERFTFLSLSESDSIKLRIGVCYVRGRRFDLANTYLEKLINGNAENHYRTEATFLLGYSFYLETKYDSCISLLKESVAAKDSLQEERSSFLLNAAYLMTERWDSFIKISISGSPLYPVQKLSLLAEQGRNLGKKDEYIAALASAIIPGLGKVYAGRPIDGLFSFVIVSLLGWQTYETFSRNGIKSLNGWMLGALGFTFYAGNIYGSILTVELYNQNATESYKKDVRVIVKTALDF